MRIRKIFPAIFLLLVFFFLDIDASSPKLKWQKKFLYEVLAPPELLGTNLLVITLHDGQVNALDNDGNLIWKYETGQGCLAAPCVNKAGTVFFTSEKNLYALTGEGKLIWQRPLSSPTRTQILLVSDQLWFCCQDGSLLTFSPEGQQLQQFKLDQQILATPAVDDQKNIYIPGWEFRLTKIDLRGQELWHLKTTGVLSSPPVINGKFLFLASMDHHLYKIDIANGRVKWKFKTNYWNQSSPLLDENGNIYFFSSDRNVYALDHAGRRKWQVKMNASSKSTGVQTDTHLYFGDDSGTLYQLSKTGKIEWTYKTGDFIQRPLRILAIDGENYLFAASIDGFFFCFHLKGH